MKFLTAGIALCLIGLVTGDVQSEFAKEEIVPDIIDEAPNQLIQVKYGDKTVNPGDELTPTEVKDNPDIHYDNENSSYYTFAFIDPDAPTRKEPIMGQWQHWLVVNIPGDDVTKGETIVPYVGAGPPKDGGTHRHIMLVYKQTDFLEFDEDRLNDTSIEGYGHFSIKKFAAKYNMGNPIAGNMFLAKFDDYVPILYKQFGIE